MPGELKDVVTHEFAHLHRFDPVLGMLQAIATIVYWPHPLIHLAKREFIKLREEVCDNYLNPTASSLNQFNQLFYVAMDIGLISTNIFGGAHVVYIIETAMMGNDSEQSIGSDWRSDLNNTCSSLTVN